MAKSVLQQAQTSTAQQPTSTMTTSSGRKFVFEDSAEEAKKSVRFMRPTNSKPGDYAQGVLLGYSKNDLSGQDDLRIEEDNGGICVVNVNNHLKQALQAKGIKINDGLRVTFLGREEFTDKQGKKKTSNKYKVISAREIEA